jgi:hypothetical protein
MLATHVADCRSADYSLIEERHGILDGACSQQLGVLLTTWADPGPAFPLVPGSAGPESSELLGILLHTLVVVSMAGHGFTSSMGDLLLVVSVEVVSQVADYSNRHS